MKVDAISAVGVRNRNNTFGQRQLSYENEPVYNPTPSGTILKKVPVLVLLAMNPATLNSAIPTMPETDNPNQIVMLAPEQKSVDKSAYVIATELQRTQQSEPPYGWGYFRSGKIFDTSSVIVDGKYNYDLVFYTPLLKRKDGNSVADVFIVDPQKQGSPNRVPHPAKIKEIIYHDLGKEKEFCSVKTEEYLVNDSRELVGFATRELRIDDDSANKILSLTLNKLQWTDDTKIDFQVSKSADIAQPKIQYFNN